MQLAQPRAGLQPELLVEMAPEGCVALERIHLTARPIEREHREPLHPLTERMLVGQREDLPQGLGVLAQPELRLEPRLAGDEPKLLEPLGLAAREVLVRHLREGRSAPQAESLLGERGGERRVAALERIARLVEEPLEALGVERRRDAVEGIPGGHA